MDNLKKDLQIYELEKEVQHLKKKVEQLTQNLKANTMPSIAVEISKKITASTKSLYDYLLGLPLIHQSDGTLISEKDYYKYLYLALITDVLKDDYYEMVANELYAISDKLLLSTLDNSNDEPLFVEFRERLKQAQQDNPYLYAQEVTLEEWKIFLHTIPAVAYHKKLNYQNYLNAQGQKIIQKLLNNKGFESKDITPIKLLLQELKKDKEKSKPNENIGIYYSMPTFIKDIEFNRQDAYETKQKILKFLTPTFDDEDNLNQGHVKQQTIDELVKEKKEDAF